MPLTHPQHRDAMRLQRAGRLLREIAREIGASYQDVCLALWGGEKPTGDAAPPAPASDQVAVDTDIEEQELGNAEPNANTLGESGTAREAPGGPAPETQKGDGIADLREGTQSAPHTDSELPERPALLPADPPRSEAATRKDAGPTAPEDLPPPVAKTRDSKIHGGRSSRIEARGSPGSPGTLYRLKDRFGEYLHARTTCMTRLEKFYWRGTEADIAALFRRNPTLSSLTKIR